MPKQKKAGNTSKHDEAIRQIDAQAQELQRLKQLMKDSPKKQSQFSLPLLALVMRVDRHLLALPVAQVEEVTPMVWVSPLPKAPKAIFGTINYRGNLIPVLDLHLTLTDERRPLVPEMFLVVSSDDQRTLALAVDGVEGVETFDSDQVESGSLVSTLPCFVHRFLRSDGRPVALLDAAGLLPAGELDLLEEALSGLIQE